jgi:hypothetical protein
MRRNKKAPPVSMTESGAGCSFPSLALTRLEFLERCTNASEDGETRPQAAHLISKQRVLSVRAIV